nr:uncharacterized protein LOC111414956 [Onthophagus taurus]
MLLFKLFVSFYGLAKEAFNFKSIQHHIARSDLLKILVRYLTVLLTLLLLSTYILVVPFILIRCILHVILLIKHGKNFGGFLKGFSALFEAQREKSTIVTVFTIENTNKDEFVEKLKLITENLHKCNYMFSSVIKSFFGYKYFLKNQIEPEQILTNVTLNSKNAITRNDLLEYLEGYKIIKDGKLWEIVVFDQPLMVAENKPNELVVMIRVNHSVTDAYFMIALYRKYLLDPVKTEQKEINLRQPKRAFSLDDLFLNTNPLNPGIEQFLFHGSENQFISTFLEHEAKYVRKIKKIKDCLDVGFTDVLLAALVKSVSDFLEKKLGKCGKDVVIHLTTRGRSDDMVNIVNGTFDTNELSNEFALLQFVAPTATKRTSAIDYLRSVNKSCINAKSSIDILLFYLIPKVTCQFFPTFINKFGCDLMLRNVCIMNTNMSAVDGGTIGNKKITSVFAYTSLHFNQGMMLNTVTFRNNIQACLVGRVEFLKNRDDIDTILKNMFVFIDELENELFERNKRNGMK